MSARQNPRKGKKPPTPMIQKPPGVAKKAFLMPFIQAMGEATPETLSILMKRAHIPRERAEEALNTLVIEPENLPLLNDSLGQLRREIEALENELRVAGRAEGMITRDLKGLARQAADYLIHLKEVLETGTVDERKRFLRAFVAEIVVEGEKRKVRVAFYDDGRGGEAPSSPLAVAEALAERFGDASPQLAPPTGFEPVSRP